VTLLASGSTFSTGTSDSFQRVHFYTQIYLVSNNQAANQTTVRVLTVVADNDPNRGGFGTASWGQNVNGAYITGGSLSYNFDAGQSYTLYDSNHTVTHNATGNASSSSYAEFNSNISLIMPRPMGVSTSATLTPYPIFGTITMPSTVVRGGSYTGSTPASNAVSYSIFSGALPTGLSLNTTNGSITGTATADGTYNFTIRATGPTGTGVPTGFSVNTAQTITVNPPTPIFSDATVNSQGIVGTSYSDAILASDAASYSVFSGALPDGLSLNASTGAITGTPTAPGVFNFVIRATNVTGNADTGTLTITVLSGGKVWNGTSFVAGITRVWDGTSFVSSTTKVWDGSEWASAS
jgi:hypothetical protein